MQPSSLVLVGVLTPSTGILGALLWPAVQRRLRLRVLILLVVAASAIPLYGVIGLFAPRGARWGLRVPAEMYVLAVYFGALYGSFQSYARALYAEMIPPGEEARWYGLFSTTDKVRHRHTPVPARMLTPRPVVLFYRSFGRWPRRR
jgi:UMF1 family MFS transporter